MFNPIYKYLICNRKLIGLIYSILVLQSIFLIDLSMISTQSVNHCKFLILQNKSTVDLAYFNEFDRIEVRALTNPTADSSYQKYFLINQNSLYLSSFKLSAIADYSFYNSNFISVTSIPRSPPKLPF